MSDFIYRYVRRPWARICRIPRSRGFGIQSPWAYKFVRSVAMNGHGGIDSFMVRLKQFCVPCGVIESNIMAHMDSLLVLLKNMADTSALVVMDIHKDRKAYMRWKQLVSDDCVGIAFDMYDFGVLFFNRKMYKRLYKVNYR